nr:MAG TPA: hypothetical protein [Caudoviricetes sp.]
MTTLVNRNQTSLREKGNCLERIREDRLVRCILE